MLHLFSFPCFPGHIGYYIVPECYANQMDENNFVLNLILKLLTSLLASYVIMFMFGSCVLECVTFVAVHCLCFHNYLKLILRNFQLKSINNMQVIQMYRELEILVKIYNEIHQGALTIGMMIMCSIVFVIGLYTWIALRNVVVMPLLLLLACVLFDVLVIIFEIDGSLKSQTYSNSEQFTTEVKRMRKLMGAPYFRRHVKSWRVIRICLGSSSNYYDNTTSLIFMGFNVNQTINVLLM